MSLSTLLLAVVELAVEDLVFSGDERPLSFTQFLAVDFWIGSTEQHAARAFLRSLP